jgi:hypothetical protein
MLSLAGLAMPQLPGVARSSAAEAAQGEVIDHDVTDSEGYAGAVGMAGAAQGMAQPKIVAASRREVPIAASLGVDLQF